MKEVKDCITEREEYTILEKNGVKITIRELQLELLTIMDEIHRVCEKNNIKYGLIAGSALGIVNYKGFIPWDDDIDICIERKDWNRFIEALKKDLSDDFYFQCFENDKRYIIEYVTDKGRDKQNQSEAPLIQTNSPCRTAKRTLRENYLKEDTAF